MDKAEVERAVEWAKKAANFRGALPEARAALETLITVAEQRIRRGLP
jgi:hypothetical protein